jgi:hypothetical protein
MHLLSSIIADIGRINGIHGLWLLVPANDINPAQPIRFNRAWLAHEHRT